MRRVIQPDNLRGSGPWHAAPRWQSGSSYGAAALVVLLLAAGCGKPTPADRALRPDQITDFSVLYQQSCAGCHGKDGALGPAPPLNDPLFQQMIADAELMSVIENGREATLMPAFAKSNGGPLTDEQVAIIVEGVRGWRKVDDSLPDAPPYQASAEDPSGIQQGNVANGQALFRQVCSDCHGEDGEGGKAGALHDTAFLTLSSNMLFRRIIITGRPDLGMPNFHKLGSSSPLGQPLSDQDVNDLVAFLRSWQTADEGEAPDEPDAGQDAQPESNSGAAAQPTEPGATSQGTTSP